jgi:hypothetical protein
MAASLGLHHWTIEDLHAVRQAQEILALEGKKDRHEYRRAEGDEGFEGMLPWSDGSMKVNISQVIDTLVAIGVAERKLL